MIKFKLPKLHSLLNSNKDIDERDFSRLIHVKDGLAFVLNDSLFVCVNLREYIKNKCKLSESEEIAEMDSILSFFDGKSFTKEFWSELVGEQDIQLDVEDLVVTKDHFTKSLDYESFEPQVWRHLDIRKEVTREMKPVDQYCINGRDLDLLMKGFKSEIASDKFIVRSTGIEHCLHFSLVRQDYIFGYLMSNYDGATEMFDNFYSFEDLIDVLNGIS